MTNVNMAQKHHNMMNPPLPIPSTANNHFSPIQSGLPIIHNGGQLNGHPQSMGFNSLNSRIAQRAPQKIPTNQGLGGGQPTIPLKSIFPEEIHKPTPAHSAAVNQTQAAINGNQSSRTVRPKPAYSNQLPVEGETQVEIIEHRQRKDKLPLKDIDDLIHLSGPLTEDAVMKTLLTRFQNDSFYVSRKRFFV